MSESNYRICGVCDQPMLPGQAFNGLKGTHWGCSPGGLTPSSRPRPKVDESRVTKEASQDLNRPAPRAPEKGPTGNDVALAMRDPEARQIESRQWVEKWRHALNGKSSIGLECPFCYEVVRAYLWSLPNGKRCTCGAFHGRLQSTHWREPKGE